MALSLTIPQTDPRHGLSESPVGMTPDDTPSFGYTPPSPPGSLGQHSDGSYELIATPLSQADSDESPLSPIVFQRNFVFERSRLSYVPPSFSSSLYASSAAARIHSALTRPHANALASSSSPSTPLPPGLWPDPASRARPLPPLPPDDDASPISEIPVRNDSLPARYRGESVSTASDRDSDSVFSSSAASSRSSSDKTSVSGASDACGPSLAPRRPFVSPLAMPLRSQSTPTIPRTPPSGGPSSTDTSPHISVTPATPGGGGGGGTRPIPPWRRAFAHSSSSLATYSDSDSEPDGNNDEDETIRNCEALRARAASPAPSLASAAGSRLKRMISKSRLFGRRTLSTGEVGWGDEGEPELPVREAQTSMDDRLLRPRTPATRPGTPSSDDGRDSLSISSGGGHGGKQTTKYEVHIFEAWVNAKGEETLVERSVADAIPILRLMKAAAHAKA